MSEQGDIPITYHGDDVLLEFVMVENGSVTGWTTKLFARATAASPDPPILAISGTIFDAGSPTTPGIFRVLISQANMLTLTQRTYEYAFKRIDAGNNKTLRAGRMPVRADIEHPLP